MREYSSVQKWLLSKDYKKGTVDEYLRELAVMCGLLHLTPDELVKQGSRATQKKLAELMRDELGYKRYTILIRLCTFRSFLEANGIESKNLCGYEDLQWLRSSAKKTILA